MITEATEADWATFERARRITVHDEIRGGYRPASAGWYDQLGYARCLDCPPPDGLQADPISADNSAAVGELCDACGAAILARLLDRAASGANLEIAV